MSPEEARIEAERCLYCYDAPCIQACPTHIDVPKFIKQIASKDLRGSAKTILEANAMGHSCARVCPVEVLCEGACVFKEWQEKPIEIARLQRRAMDAYYAPGTKPLFAAGKATGKRVAVVGAGPSGLSCAFYLRRLGHAVVLFERRDAPGGLNSFGVAEYKMTQATALQEAAHALSLGPVLKTGVRVGPDIPASRLASEFDAVFIGIGLGGTKSLRIPGEELPGVLDALTFIEAVKNRDLSSLAPSSVTVVLGGGNTAIDAVTQSKRIGTPRVVLAYRRGRPEMPAYGFEVDLAKSDGAEFLWNASPVRVLGTSRVEGVEFQRTRTQGGKLVVLDSETFTLPCDRVIKAIGQDRHPSFAEEAGLAVEGLRIRVAPKTLRTSHPKFWAGGDAVNDGKEVVNAAADGKRAAWSIHQAVTGAKRPAPEHAYWVSTIGPHPRGVRSRSGGLVINEASNKTTHTPRRKHPPAEGALT